MYFDFVGDYHIILKCSLKTFTCTEPEGKQKKNLP
jgi:hypothetical protein